MPIHFPAYRNRPIFTTNGVSIIVIYRQNVSLRDNEEAILPNREEVITNQKKEPNKVKALRLARLAQGLSQVVLADLTNCSIRTITRIEKGSEARASDLIKTQIANALNLNIDSVFPPSPLSNHLTKKHVPSYFKFFWHSKLLQQGPFRDD